MQWKNININKTNIEVETAKAVLIKMPNSSPYHGFKFWHPKKLVRNGRNKGAVSLSYTNEFSFKLIKNGQGRFNSKDIIDEKTLSVEEFEECFGVINDNITSKKPTETFVEVTEPTKLEVTEHKPDDKLIV